LLVSLQPTFWGEKLVMRLLDSAALPVVGKLGFEPPALESFTNALAQPNGLVLLAGPRGSGKTTTLYSALTSLERPEGMIATAEDPIELTLPGAKQSLVCHIHHSPQAIEETLNGALAQRPDILLVGQIWDDKTAKFVVEAAARGPLVLTTVDDPD